jgi:sucrose-6-phosphate hydrolase SacC (GH32 family)
MPFNQMMNFPVELTLRSTNQGIRMFAEPVREIALLHGEERRWENRTLTEGENLLAGVTGELFHLRGEFEPAGAEQFDLKIRGTAVSYDVATQELSCAGKKAPVKLADGKIRLELLVDRTSIEIFADGGRVYMPIGAIPADDNQTLELTTTGGQTKVVRLSVHPLRSAWGR